MKLQLPPQTESKNIRCLVSVQPLSTTSQSPCPCPPRSAFAGFLQHAQPAESPRSCRADASWVFETRQETAARTERSCLRTPVCTKYFWKELNKLVTVFLLGGIPRGQGLTYLLSFVLCEFLPCKCPDYSKKKFLINGDE